MHVPYVSHKAALTADDTQCESISNFTTYLWSQPMWQVAYNEQCLELKSWAFPLALHYVFTSVQYTTSDMTSQWNH